MIFFKENIDSFKSNSGIIVSPIPTVLKNNEVGFRLGDEWRDVIKIKGAVTMDISKDDIQEPSAF